MPRISSTSVVSRPAGLTRDLPGRDGHERALVGPHVANERQQVRPGIAFDVELDPPAVRRQHGGQVVDVLEGDVPRVRRAGAP